MHPIPAIRVMVSESPSAPSPSPSPSLTSSFLQEVAALLTDDLAAAHQQGKGNQAQREGVRMSYFWCQAGHDTSQSLLAELVLPEAEGTPQRLDPQTRYCTFLLRCSGLLCSTWCPLSAGSSAVETGHTGTLRSDQHTLPSSANKSCRAHARHTASTLLRKPFEFFCPRSKNYSGTNL